jgi:hypothetical protein
MPRLIITKCFVLVHPDGEIERLNSLEDMHRAFELSESAPDDYLVEQRDIVELRAA